ncbi:MAG: hypothetical protein K2O59_04925 [Lachnospiraceae bacterium]|nr:hypothetical protein [Lachnospiraceae bacterium]
MNCCWIILLLLFCGQNGNGIFGGNGNGGCGRNGNDGYGRSGNDGRNGCGCDEPVRPCARSESPRGRQDAESCPCEESRFEPRFEQRPFNGNGSTCGCEAEGN